MNEKGIKLEEEGLGFDYVFKRLPTVSWYQLGLFLMSNWLFFCAGFTQVGSVILQANEDSYRCRTEVDDKFDLNYSAGLSFSPEEPCEGFTYDWTTCDAFMKEYEDGFNFTEEVLPELEKCFESQDGATIDCPARIFDTEVFDNTVISEWDLVCEQKGTPDILTAIFMSGLFFGVMIFGPMSDKLGRVNTIAVATVGLIAIQLATAFLPKSWTVWSYAVFRMVGGSFAIGGGTTGFVYIMEIIGTKWRTWFGVDSQLLFSVGYMALSVVGYFARDWRMQMIIISVIPVVFFIFYFLLPSSARFMFSAGRDEDAKKALRRIATHFPEKEIDDEFIDQVQYSTQLAMSSQTDDVVYTQADLFKSAGTRKVTLLCMYQWFATTLVYYGLSFGAGSLGGNLLANNLMNGLVEFICYCFLPAFIDIRCIGRKYGVIITMAIGSIGCFISAAFGELSRNELDDEVRETYELCMKIFAIVGKFGVSGTFGVIYVHASELYPTPIRSIGVGLASAAGRIGGILAPLINGLERSVGWLPMAIFGTLGLLQVLSTFWLPETLGIQMLATVEAAEDFYAGKKPHQNKVESEVSSKRESTTSSL